MEVGKRIPSLDYVKGATIFLVVWMHVIQYCAGQTFENLLFTKVYSFHMPVFMVISGFLFYTKLSSEGMNIKVCGMLKLLRKQFERLILPNCIWGVILLLTKHDCTWRNILNLPNSCWFLSVLFVVSVSYYMLSFLLHNKVVLSTVATFITFFLPGAEFLKFFIPFFGIGLLLRHYDVLNRLSITSLLALVVLSLALIVFFKPQYTIYLTPTPTIWHYTQQSIWAYLYRMVVGTTLTVVLVKIAGMIKSDDHYVLRLLHKLSVNSLGIYVIHILVLSNLITPFLVNNNKLVVDVLAFVIAIVIIAIIVKLIDLLRINRIVRLFTLGENKI